MEGTALKKLVAIGVGAAVYIVLARFAAVPTPIPNITIQVTYAFLALMAFIYGPIVGFAIGFIGHTLNDVMVYGNPWFSWIIVSGIFGFATGLVGKIVKIENFDKIKVIKFLVSEVIICAIGWGTIAPMLDIVIYKEPSAKVFLQGITAGTSNFITVAVIGTLLITAYSKTIVGKGSLKKEV